MGDDRVPRRLGHHDTLVVVWAADAGTRRTGDGESLWLLGAIMLAGAATIVGVMVARATTIVSDRRRRRTGRQAITEDDAARGIT